ncbi:Type 4 fimbriae expression regulatory protein PilR [Georgfuchsia toluolica]|uniref:Type 4 fimbriae expression regulatory protein PilR n=1 Tax=Georgfuchsia toluolica TaxID=424218 RepID=A0A916N3N2_9PROT|nr:sigma-54 dependent transcriptional regulator [Georgfuchsia toluolica]CAG4885251.1 Type 4 fimbriae expression regulatory protein PilR [Georgfuchsia toluolica]
MNSTTIERRKRRVLVVDDEADIRELLDLTLVRMGFEADCAATLAEARALLKARRYRLCLTDMRLPDGEGLDLVRYIGETCTDLPVAVITAHGSMENAVSALKAGAFDYLAKPVALDQLRALIKSALDLPQNAIEGGVAQDLALLGESRAIVEVRAMIERVARSQAPVHIGGESGSGKELAARLIHQLSARQNGSFVPVNCGAIPENLMESEFFGYRKGAFTGADGDRDGFFQTANGGTLFLDEVADLPLLMQVKLLRAIQEKRVRKVGSPNEEPVDVRVISATHQQLKDMVDAGKFRQDLFYRLNVIEVSMPALRDCREDIGLLSTMILEKLALASGLVTPKLSASALRALTEYPFPGNVRELENILERAIALLQGDVIDAVDLHLSPVMAETAEAPSSLQDYLDGVEKKTILEALQKTRFNRTAAAKLLGVTFRSLRYRMQRLNLNE